MGVLWDIFRFTGEPMAYVLYRTAEEAAKDNIQ